MRFQSTRWSLVLRAGNETLASRRALGELCQIYWPAVLAFVRSKGNSHADSADLTQGFFAYAIEKNMFHRADANKGRFRNFLKAAVRNYMANEWDKSVSQKRGGGAVHINIDSAEWLASTPESHDCEHEFDRAWGITLLKRALERLRAEYEQRDRLEIFDALQPVLTGEGIDQTYQEIGVQHGISENAVKVTVHRMRSRFRELLEEEVVDTVHTPEEARQELVDFRELFMR